jgi:hypothetical protein
MARSCNFDIIGLQGLDLTLIPSMPVLQVDKTLLGFSHAEKLE